MRETRFVNCTRRRGKSKRMPRVAVLRCFGQKTAPTPYFLPATPQHRNTIAERRDTGINGNKIVMATNPLAPKFSAKKLDLALDHLAAQKPSGRLIFGLDATMSRQPTWDQACELQAQMFAEAAAVGGLEIQVAFYRGEECRASEWMTDPVRLGAAMRRIQCVGGTTQIGRILDLARRAHDKAPVSALAFVGDAMEETLDVLCGHANKLGSRGVRALMFQEGTDETVERAFREIARLTHGAYHSFSTGSAAELGALLRGAAAYAAGGLKALQGKKEAVKLLEQLK